MEQCPLFTIPSLMSTNAAAYVKVSPLNDMRILQEAISRFKVLRVDPAEFACLKAIVLFKSGKLLTVCEYVLFGNVGMLLHF